MLQSPSAGASQSWGTSIAAFEPGNSARNDTAGFGAKSAFDDKWERTRAHSYYLDRILQFCSGEMNIQLTRAEVEVLREGSSGARVPAANDRASRVKDAADDDDDDGGGDA